jgi:hypothetical protein
MLSHCESDRRSFLKTTLGSCVAAAAGGLAGCTGNTGDGRSPNLLWGRFGRSEGRFNKPRAMVLSPSGELYIVDK